MTMPNDYDDIEIPPAPLPPLPEPHNDSIFGGLANWVGRPNPETDASDGISDLFDSTLSQEQTDTDDLVDVDLETDILDADPDGGFGSLVDVSRDDVIGGQRSIRPRVRPSRPPYQPPGMGLTGFR